MADVTQEQLRMLTTCLKVIVEPPKREMVSLRHFLEIANIPDVKKLFGITDQMSFPFGTPENKG